MEVEVEPRPVIPQQHSIISSDGYAEGSVPHHSREATTSVVVRAKRRAVACLEKTYGAAGARPKRGGGGDSLDEGSVETVYSEDDQLNSNGPGGEGKQHSPQAAVADRARAMQQRDQMRQQMQEDDFAQQQQMQGQVAPPS